MVKAHRLDAASEYSTCWPAVKGPLNDCNPLAFPSTGTAPASSTDPALSGRGELMASTAAGGTTDRAGAHATFSYSRMLDSLGTCLRSSCPCSAEATSAGRAVNIPEAPGAG